VGERISRVAARAIRIPRDIVESEGTAGAPGRLGELAGPRYRWAAAYRTLYSDHLETVIVSVETESGLAGWGEAQAPVAPEITRSVIDSLLGPLLIGADALAPEAAWARMYSAMRVRGHTGSFLLDAMAGIDLALWDICGRAYGQPIFRLLGGPCHDEIPCYVSGLAGASIDRRVEEARHHVEHGARAFKLFLSATEAECLAELDALRTAFGTDVELYVDALWRLDVGRALRFAGELAARGVAWLEAPLVPEDVAGHARLAHRSAVPIALGESYRTRFELRPFFERQAVSVLQPDVGRSGITETRKLAALADTFHVPLAPHVSLGLGPQLAAGLHVAAATSNLARLEYNPRVHDIANRFLLAPLLGNVDAMTPPTGPGLGVIVDESALAPYVIQ
jgi:galactonate dehydratase